MSEENNFEIQEVPTSRGSMFLIWVILIVAITALGFFFFGRVVDGYHAARLLAGHEVVPGTITKTGFSRDPARYRVVIEGQNFTGQAGRQSQGETIQIAYIPGSPHINRPADDLWFDAIAGAVIVMAVPIGLFVIIVRDRKDAAKFAEVKRKAEIRRLKDQAKTEKANASNQETPPPTD